MEDKRTRELYEFITFYSFCEHIIFAEFYLTQKLKMDHVYLQIVNQFHDLSVS